MEDGVRVVLGMESGDVAEEVMHLLDRSGRARVVASADDDRHLAEAVRQIEPDVVVAQPSLCGAVSSGRHAVIALETRESVASLRTAIAVGARGYFVWPVDREALGAAVAAIRPASDADGLRGRIIGIHASRGGAGATVLATGLAAALAAMQQRCVVIDADLVGADVGPSLGAPEEGIHTAAVLLRMGEELTGRHIADAMWSHPSGVHALLAPPPEAQYRDPEAWRRIVLATAAQADTVVVDLGTCPPADLLVSMDHVVEVLAPDVRTFRAAARFLDTAPSIPVGFVLNKAGRAELVAGDVARAFGSAPLAVIPSDPAVARAQAAGRLPAAKSRAGRAFRRLATALLSPGEDAAREEVVQEL